MGEPIELATLVYDGECAMCRASALWLMRRAQASGALEILPCRSPVRRERFPQIADAECMLAMQLVLPDGRVLAGADAVPELLRRVRGWRHVARVFALPGVRRHALGPAPPASGWPPVSVSLPTRCGGSTSCPERGDVTARH